MDPRFPVTREEFYNVQMDVKQVQFVQQSHGDRLSRLEKRQAEEAAIKSAWNSPFPSVIGGTPQHGPAQLPNNDVFDDFDEQGQNLLGSLHLDAEDEPVRRGAASRANSVRFDESALQGATWSGQSGRQSGEFGPARPSSRLSSQPLMERSLSHKSDGRHSSAGQSVHSAASGRANSFGIDTNFLLGDRGEDSPLPIPGPPPGFFFLGSVPSIIRCWLTANFAHKSLLYAAVCSGSQRSTIAYSLLRELDLVDDIHKDADGMYRITLAVYLAEAIVTQANARSPGLPPQLPNIDVAFQVVGAERPLADVHDGIRIILGSDTLRAGSADVLFSQNLMTLYSSDRDRLSIPFVRPEDEGIFKDLCTVTQRPERQGLNASAAEFVSEAKSAIAKRFPESEPEHTSAPEGPEQRSAHEPRQSAESAVEPSLEQVEAHNTSGSAPESDKPDLETAEQEIGGSEAGVPPEGTRRESLNSSIWSSWRQGASGGGGDGHQRENGPLSGYQPAGRGSRTMKILKPGKSTASASARTGPAYEPPPSSRSSGEYARRKCHASSTTSAENSTPNSAVAANSNRWDAKRTASHAEITAPSNPPTSEKGSLPVRESRKVSQLAQSHQGPSALPRSANPVGGASAFSWMGPIAKPRTPATTAD